MDNGTRFGHSGWMRRGKTFQPEAACPVRRFVAGAARCAGVVLLVACDDAGRSASNDPTRTTAAVVASSTSSDSAATADPQPVTTDDQMQSSADQAAFEAVLAQLDVAVGLAPTEAVHLGDATPCGWDQLGGPPLPGDKVDAEARECFLAAHRSGRPAVFVNQTRDNEGSSVPIIFRTEAGQVTMYWDWTKSLSSEAWRTETCSTLYVEELREPPAPVFSCTQWPGSEPA